MDIEKRITHMSIPAATKYKKHFLTDFICFSISALHSIVTKYQENQNKTLKDCIWKHNVSSVDVDGITLQ